MSRQTSQKIAFAILTALAVVVVVPIVLVVAYIVVQGLGAVNWEFLTAFPRNGMKEGGILPAVVGTVVLTFGTAIVSIPIAVGRGHLPGRVRPRHLADAGHPPGHHQPGRHPLGGLWAVRPGIVCALSGVGHQHRRRQPDPGA